MSDLYGMGNNVSLNNNMGAGPNNKKKIFIIAGAGIIGLIVILIIILLVISAAEQENNNIIIDGDMTKLDATMWYVGEDNVPYICVERIAPKLSYDFYNGEYGTGSEEKTHCYVKNQHELVLMEMDTNIIYKALINNEALNFDTYKMSYKVKRLNNDKLFISLPTMQKVFNVKYSYNSSKNVLTIDTLPALYSKYNAAVKKDGYYSISDSFENQKALLQNMIVVITKERQVGILNTNDGSVIVGTKYPEMLYSEGMNEFLVKNNNKYGILTQNSQGESVVKIEFQYDALKLIDNNLGIYLVKNDEKYGALDRNGKVLINLDYDFIGVENPRAFPTENLKNIYILYDNCIPVKQADKWGLFLLSTGKLEISPRLNGFGAIVSTSQTSQNVLLIPASEGMEGIVASTRNGANKVKYGVLDAQQARFRVAPSYDSIYKTVSGGITEYNMLFGNTIFAVKDKIVDRTSEASGSESSTVEIQ